MSFLVQESTAAPKCLSHPVYFPFLGFKRFTICPQSTNPPHFSALSIGNLPLQSSWLLPDTNLPLGLYLCHLLFHLRLLNLSDFIKFLLQSTKTRTYYRKGENEPYFQPKTSSIDILVYFLLVFFFF